jgi:selenocysteine lyase/cysteine desulfurase
LTQVADLLQSRLCHQFDVRRLTALVGAGVSVPLVTGEWVPYCYLDNAASTPCLVTVRKAVVDFLEYYSSVHRGSGLLSAYSTEVYEDARKVVASFVDARYDDCVIFTRNTTDSTNLIASVLNPEDEVLVCAGEHHANLLPWRKGKATTLPVARCPGEVLERLEAALRAGSFALVAVTAASNVTGEIWPIAEIVALAHRYGARVVVDAAQLAPHHPISIKDWDADWVVFSGHKLYAPFGAGVVVGRCDWLSRAKPYLFGGGAVDYVLVDDVMWTGLPDLHEAGSPNTVGAMALGVACQTLSLAGMARLAGAESLLLDVLRRGLSLVPGLTMYEMWPGDCDRIGLVTFNLANVGYAELAAILSAEFGIGVRHGCFCAHPLMACLLGISDDMMRTIGNDLHTSKSLYVPGAVRVSLSVGSSLEDIIRLLNALHIIADGGSKWKYLTTSDGKDCIPLSDGRSLPTSPFDLSYLDI